MTMETTISKFVSRDAMGKKLYLNIFRSLPHASHENTESEGGYPEEDEMFMDPTTWPHLQLVYELLLCHLIWTPKLPRGILITHLS